MKTVLTFLAALAAGFAFAELGTVISDGPSLTETLEKEAKEEAAAEKAKEAAAIRAKLEAGGLREVERVQLYKQLFRKLPTEAAGIRERARILLESDEPKKVKLLASEDLFSSYNIRYGIWCEHFYSRYCEPQNWPDDLVELCDKAYWAAAKIRCEACADSFETWRNYGEACLVAGKNEEALRAYEKAIATFKDPKKGGKNLAISLYGRANALLALGRREEALAALKDYLGRKLPGFGGRHEEHIDSYAAAAINDLEGRDLDLLKMPRFSGAKAFPTPQQAEYAEKFVAVTGYDLEVKGLDAKDRRLELLETKFTRFGAPKKAGAAFKVSVTVDPATKAFADMKDPKTYAAFRAKRHAEQEKERNRKIEDKSPEEFRDYMENEAYTLEVTEKGATIVAKTKQGALWGIVSLIQLWDQVNHKIRLAKIRDWPDIEKRGFLCSYWSGLLEFCLFNKMNSICPQSHPCCDNMFRPVNWYLEEFLGQQFHDFGFELFFGVCWMTHAPQLPICSPRTLPYRISICKRYAKAHIGIYYPLDDIRFPNCHQDHDAYGEVMGKIDGEHQNAIYQAVIKEYPEWRFVVCPPPYMGPDGGYRQVESRDHYLRDWSQALDKRVEGYWTGPRVKSWRFEPYHNEWVLYMYGRRPYLFQNGIGYHNLLDYTVDGYDWPGHYCKGTLDKVLGGYHLNTHTPTDTARISTLADALWDIGRYEPDRASERGLAQMSGEKMYSLLIPALGDLSYFDKYVYGDTDERVELEDKAALERMALNVETCWSNAQAYAKQEGVPIYGSFGRGVGWMRQVMHRLRNPPDFAKVYGRQLEASRCAALTETGVNVRRGETYASPMSFSGGALEIVKHAARGSEEWPKEMGLLFRSLKCAETKFAKASVRFTCETFPPGADYHLILCGASAGKANLRLLINGETFFEGDPKIGGDAFKPRTKTFVIPEAKLKRNNTLTIENLNPGKDPEASKDSFRIRYAVIRTAEENTEEPEADEGDGIDLSE